MFTDPLVASHPWHDTVVGGQVETLAAAVPTVVGASEI